MSLPKRKKPVAAKLDKAFQTMEAIGAPTPEQARGNAAGAKRGAGYSKSAGRPSAAPNRTARYHFVLSEETLNRLNIAYPQELIKKKREGVSTDKSLLIESALIGWLDKNGY